MALWSVLGTDSRSRHYCIDRDTVGVSFVSNPHLKHSWTSIQDSTGCSRATVAKVAKRIAAA